MTLAFDLPGAPASPLSRLDPRWKLAAIVLAMIAIAVLHMPTFTFAAGLVAALLLTIARLPRRLLWTRFGGFALFLLPFLIVLLILRGTAGLLPAAVVGVRAATLFAFALILVATTPMHRLGQAAQSLGVPRALTQIGLMTYRYLFVLRDEFERIRTALRARGFRSGANLRTYRTVGHVTAHLLVRGDERAERVGQAMRCRGFDGRFRSLHRFHARAGDVVFFFAVSLTSALLVAGDWLLGM